MYSTDRARMFSAFDSGWDVETAEKNRERLMALAQGVEIPEGTTSPRPYSAMMDVYAAWARFHMRTFGTTREQIRRWRQRTTRIRFTIRILNTAPPTASKTC